MILVFWILSLMPWLLIACWISAFPSDLGLASNYATLVERFELNLPQLKLAYSEMGGPGYPLKGLEVTSSSSGRPATVSDKGVESSHTVKRYSNDLSQYCLNSVLVDSKWYSHTGTVDVIMTTYIDGPTRSVRRYSDNSTFYKRQRN